VEPVIRPQDGRYGENPYRFQHYFQYQVILKPAPEDVLDRYFESLAALGIDLRRHDVRLVEDDWEQPTLGAWGLGWEVWCDGMEITQFTYFQQLGGLDIEVVPAEMTYGLERLALFLQGKRSVFDLEWAPGVSGGAGCGSSHARSRRPTWERMPTLLLEIGCEELPAWACREAEAQLPELARTHLGVEPSRLLIGARRLALAVDDVPERTPDQWVKGP